MKQLYTDRKYSFTFLYAAVILVSFCLLVSEILLVRILSAIFYYHLVFFVVSLVMFGMTIGGMIVYLCPGLFRQERLYHRMIVATVINALGVVFSFVALFWLPAVFKLWGLIHLLMPVLFLILSVPFIAFGMTLSLCLAHFPDRVAKVYGANLVGSALGCLSVVFLLNNFNAAAIIFLLSFVLLIAAMSFSLAGGMSARFRLYCSLLAAGFICFFFIADLKNVPRLLYAKDNLLVSPVNVFKWNFHSYVSIEKPTRKPFGWGFSYKVEQMPVKTDELMLMIDHEAGTVLTKFSDISDLEYLKYDVTSVGYNLGRLDDVLVLGAGGGRDVLTASVFGAKNITGVEINKDVYDLAFNKLDEFSGGIKKYPHISFVVDEGRSYVLRSARYYDLIQVSLVDSFAATANGAFALTENSLYSTDAWVSFLGYLKQGGQLAFSVWYNRNDPRYIYRLVNVATRALRLTGIKDVRDHIALVVNMPLKNGLRIGTLLVSRSGFTAEDMARLEKACYDRGFEVILSPVFSAEPVILELLDVTEDEDLFGRFGLDLRPPDDNRPFFFYFAKFSDVFSFKAGVPHEARFLRQLFFAIIIFGVVGILLPVFLHFKRSKIRDFSRNSLFYFFSIGFGFMLVEISLMQRLGIFFGHPIYGVSLVLFSLLFFSGIGSMVSGALQNKRVILGMFLIFVLILLMLANVLPAFLSYLTPAPLMLKVCFSVAFLAVIGFFMGMPFPLGMRHLASSAPSKILSWSINGFASICGSAASILFLVHFGFKMTFVLSLFFYCAAFLFLAHSFNKDTIRT